jgi:hypothetical protein
MWHYLDDSGNLHSLPALGGGYLEAIFSAGEQSAPLSGPSTQGEYFLLDSRTAASRVSQFGTMSPLSTASRGTDTSTLSAGDSPAKTFPWPEKATDSTGSVPVSGGKWRESLAKYDPVSRSWRTAQRSLFEDSTECLETLPRWGTTRRGELFQQQTLVRPTSESESGSWPTPDANMGARGTQPEWNRRRPSGARAQYTINQAVRDQEKFATPQSSDYRSGMASRWESKTRPSGATASRNLNDQIAKWPTPTVNMVSGGPNHSSPQVLAGNHGINLHGAVLRDQERFAIAKWPTPTVNDSKNSTLPPSQITHDNIPGEMLRQGEVAGGQLNSDWVEWLMGWPIGWTDLRPLAMDRFRQWLDSHGKS